MTRKDYQQRLEAARSLAVRANQAIADGTPLVIDADGEKIAIRSYVEREFVYWQERQS